MENLDHFAWVFGIGAAVGGGIVGVISAYIAAYHRTRGSRRQLASQATKAAMGALLGKSIEPQEIVRIQAELYSFYFNAILKAEDGGLDTKYIENHIPLIGAKNNGNPDL